MASCRQAWCSTRRVVGAARPPGRLRRLDVGRRLLPHRVGLRRELPLLPGGQGPEVVEALVDLRAERDEPLAGGRVVLLDGGLAEVVGLHQQVPDRLDLDAGGLVDGLRAELPQRRDREAEGDQSRRGDRRDRQHGRERQPQAAAQRRPRCRGLAHGTVSRRRHRRP
jgi:hypothetical protein